MFVSFGENFQLGVDCVAALGEHRHIVFGWHMTPRGLPVELSFATPDGRNCRVEYISRHPRVDVVPQDPGAAVVGGFSLVVSTPHAARGVVLTITCGDQSGYANLSEPAATTDLFRATEERDWGVTFGLLKECMQRPDALPLLSYQYRPFGAFAGWMSRLPLIQGSAENISVVARVAAAASPAGEVAVDLGFIGRSRGTVGLDVLALARLRSDDGGPDEIALLPLLDPMVRHVPGASAFYAHIGWEHVARLRSLDLIVQVSFDAERVWLRCQPRMATVPAFLDMLGAAGAGQAGQALLREVLRRRTDVVTALIQAEHAASASAASAGATRLDRPELALIGVDDQAAIRLLHLLASELEAGVSAIMLLGAAAETAGQIFIRRGNTPVSVAAEAGAIVTRAQEIGAANLVASDIPSLAAASIEDSIPSLLRRARMGGLGRLLLLHAAAGPTGELGESLSRYASFAENPDEFWLPVALNWRTALGAELVNEHLEAMWRFQPEVPPDLVSREPVVAAAEFGA